MIGNYKEDYVDTQWNMDSSFERLRYMLERLPSWMKPKDLISKYMSISSQEIRAEIAWDSWENFWTGWRRKWIFMDEFALWRTDSTAWRKTKDVTNCRIIWWTPEWKLNIYWKIMTNHPDFAHLNIKKFRLHWSSHPLKTKEWYDEQKQQRTKLEIAQELDISYDNSVAGAVYEDFERLVKIWKVEYNPEFKLYTSWDFWRDSNCIQFWQKDFKYNKLFLINSVKRVDWHIEEMCAFILWEPIQGYVYDKADFEKIEQLKNLKGRYSWHFGDPYNGNSIQTNAVKSVKDYLADYWIHLTLKTWTTVATRIRDTKLALNKIEIDYENNIDVIESMRQSHYPKVKEWSQSTTEKTTPVHDENSHHRTAFEYFIDNEPKSLPKQILNQKKTFINKFTGEKIHIY